MRTGASVTRVTGRRKRHDILSLSHRERVVCVCVCFLTPAGCVSLHHRCEAAPLPAALVSSLLPFDQHTHTFTVVCERATVRQGLYN